jgi:hypothetical protein
VVAGRQAGFKAFFSRGERNGFGYPASGPSPAPDSSHLVPKILLACLFVGLVGVLGAYYYKTFSSQHPSLSGPDNNIDLGISSFFGGGGVKTKTSTPKRVHTTLIYPTCGQPGYETEVLLLYIHKYLLVVIIFCFYIF